MQTGVDCNGSGNSSTSITTTTTTTIMKDTRDELCPSSTATTSTVTLTPPPQSTNVGALGYESPNVLRQRLQAIKPNTTKLSFDGSGDGGIASNINMHKNGNALLLETNVEYLGSNVEQMSATPTPSPQSSPIKKCKLTTTTTSSTITAAAAPKILTTDVKSKNQNNSNININNGSSSSSSSSLSSSSSNCSNSNTNSSSNSTTSSVIATPIMSRNGNAFVRDVSGKGVGGGNVSIPTHCRTTVECNELLATATKTLPLPPKSISLMTFDEQYFNVAEAITEMSTPLTPTPTTVNGATATTATATPASIINKNNSTATKQHSKLLEYETNLLHWNDMPRYLQFNPYVLKGYRPLQTFSGCLLSLFYWHNETINILSHAIPIVYILAIVPGLMPWEQEYRFLSFCHVFGSVAPWCGSFVYHLFMNIERGENVYYRLLKLDMVGIWVSQSFGALPLVTATTFCFSYKWKWFIIISYCLLSLWGLYKALTASSPWQRRLCFALPFSMRSILTFLRTMDLVGGNRVALPHVYLQDGVSIIGGAIGAMRIPEKWFPGLVDFYLNSHNIMHVLVVVAVYSMHKATVKDFEWMLATTCDPVTNTTSQAIESTLHSNIEL